MAPTSYGYVVITILTILVPGVIGNLEDYDDNLNTDISNQYFFSKLMKYLDMMYRTSGHHNKRTNNAVKWIMIKFNFNSQYFKLYKQVSPPNYI